MGKQRKAIGPTRAAHDLIGIIKRIGREIAAGLDVNDNEAIAKLARQIEPDLTPRINPDRSYSTAELERWALTHSFFYGRHRHLIRHDGRKAFVWGREVLAEIEAMPKLAPDPVAVSNAATAPRGRGRPRKNPAKILASALGDPDSIEGVTVVLPLDDFAPPNCSGMAMHLRIASPPLCSGLYEDIRARIQDQGSG
jgi:hypothetical protein